jgi:hypothetical protein
MVDAGERVQSEPLRERAHEMLGAVEFDGSTAERRRMTSGVQRSVSTSDACAIGQNCRSQA